MGNMAVSTLPAPLRAPAGLRAAGVLGLGTALPAGVVPTSMIAARLGVEPDWLTSRTGIRARRHAAPGVHVSDIAVEAGTAALVDAGLRADELDLVLVATTTPDDITPNVAPVAAHALGATRAGAYDIGSACAGFLAALSTGALWIEAGRAERVLVIGAELLSRITDPDDRQTAGLFGDGAGAIVLGPVAAGGGLGPVVLHQDGAGAERLYARHARGVIEMEGQEVFRHAVARMEAVTHETLAATGIGLGDVDLFVYHQANQRITRALGQRLGVDPERVVDCIAEVGNTSAATLPLALAHAEGEGRLAPGSTVLLAAFGAGFTWGGAVLTW